MKVAAAAVLHPYDKTAELRLRFKLKEFHSGPSLGLSRTGWRLLDSLSNLTAQGFIIVKMQKGSRH